MSDQSIDDSAAGPVMTQDQWDAIRHGDAYEALHVVRGMIAAAVAAEREACAKVAAEGLIVGQQNAIGILHAKGWNEACRDIAARIRGRK